MTINSKFSLTPDHNWLVDARRIESPNQDERPQGEEINLLVIHGISLPPGVYGGDHINRLFTNTLDPDTHPCFADICMIKVSAHVLIDRNGHLFQYVPFARRAWHAGESTFRDRPRCNDYSIGIELEGCDNHPYTEDQYLTLAGVTQVLVTQWPAITRERIVGHSEIAPGRKTDPGVSFNWGFFFKLLDTDGYLKES